MLQYTFRRIKGFGAKKEADLWRAHTHTWEDFERTLGTQLPLFPDIPEEIEQSPFWLTKIALEAKDTDYLTTNIPHREHFRIAYLTSGVNAVFCHTYLLSLAIMHLLIGMVVR